MVSNKRPQEEWSIPEIIDEYYSVETRETKPRDYIYASEIGMPLFDRYYSMKGTVPTEHVGSRVRRIFQEGYSREMSVVNIMKDIGLFSETQTTVELPEDKEHLRISGRLDLLVDGGINWDKQLKKLKASLKKEELKDASKHSNKIQRIKAALVVVKRLSEEKRNLRPYICEIKSINSKAFWRSKDNLRNAYLHHSLQLYTYLKAFGLDKSKFDRGKVLYVSRDDACMEEIPVMKDDLVLEEAWQNDVRSITKAFRDNKPPEPEPWLAKGDYGWCMNWKLKYSPYLSKITGCETLKEFEEICANYRKLQRDAEGRAPALKRGRKTEAQRISNQFDKLL
jgi:hypothetical protein